MKLLALTALAAVLSSCNNTGSSDAAIKDSMATIHNEPDSGWIVLFDGKTTNGWHTYGKAAADSAWKVADGALCLDTAHKEGGQIKGGGDIVTDESFENFHFKLDWKISPSGNSGIIFLVNEDTAKYDHVWKTGPEMQVLDNNGHPDAKIPKHRAGDLYDLISSAKEMAKPVGEWNTAEIIVNKGRLDLVLNGTTTVSTTLWDEAWKKLIAGSKFASMPGFGTFTSGKISLQDHGNMVWFKNIVIKKL